MNDNPARCRECGTTNDRHSIECGASWSPDFSRHEPAAWIDFADNGNIRFWTADPDRAKAEQERGRPLRMFTLAELVALAALDRGAKP